MLEGNICCQKNCLFNHVFVNHKFYRRKNAKKNLSSLVFFRAQTNIKWHQVFCLNAEVLNIFPNRTGETLAISIFGDKRVRALILNFGKLNVKFSEKRARNQTRCHSYNMNLVSWDFLFIPHFGYCKIIWNIWKAGVQSNPELELQ